MHLRLPLLARILGWLFLNLLLVVAAGYVVFRVQFRLGLDFLLAGRAGDRVQALADGIAAELSEQPRRNWDAVLRRFGEAHGAQFLLLRAGDGQRLAGESEPLPPAVLERVTGRRGAFGFRGGSGGAGIGGPGAGGGPGQRGVMPRGPAGGPPAAAAPQLRERARFLVRTEAPTRYWVGLRVQVRDAEPLRPNPAVLLIVSPSLHGGGLFLDLRPWLVVGGAVAALSVLFWLPLVRGITRSIAAATRATGQIAEGRFDVRVPATRRDELGQLGDAVNRMAARLEDLVGGQKRFLGDIAHELCSPLSRIQMSLGILEQRLPAGQETTLAALREEVDQMSALVGELLSFSKASFGAGPVKLEDTALRPLVESAVRREAAPGVVLEVNVPGDLRVQAAPPLLLRALSNVLRNAIRYAGDAGPIVVSASQADAGRARIAVTDAGPGVPEESLPRLFDPFYRVDGARSRETGGVGLGLTLVKTCIEACGGTVSCRNLSPRGFEVELHLAVAPTPASIEVHASTEPVPPGTT